MKFLICKTCGKIIEVLKESKCQLTCCGSSIEEMIPGISDGAYDKHVPIIEKKGNEVRVIVSSIEHPMIETHYIEWIAIKTNKGIQRKNLEPNEKPEKVFLLTDDEDLHCAYAYCNLHSLWKSE